MIYKIEIPDDKKNDVIDKDSGKIYLHDKNHFSYFIVAAEPDKEDFPGKYRYMVLQEAIEPNINVKASCYVISTKNEISIFVPSSIDKVNAFKRLGSVFAPDVIYASEIVDIRRSIWIPKKGDVFVAIDRLTLERSTPWKDGEVATCDFDSQSIGLYIFFPSRWQRDRYIDERKAKEAGHDDRMDSAYMAHCNFVITQSCGGSRYTPTPKYQIGDTVELGGVNGDYYRMHYKDSKFTILRRMTKGQFLTKKKDELFCYKAYQKLFKKTNCVYWVGEFLDVGMFAEEELIPIYKHEYCAHCGGKDLVELYGGLLSCRICNRTTDKYMRPYYKPPQYKKISPIRGDIKEIDCKESGDIVLDLLDMCFPGTSIPKKEPIARLATYGKYAFSIPMTLPEGSYHFETNEQGYIVLIANKL